MIYTNSYNCFVIKLYQTPVLISYFKALPLPQLSREEGYKLIEAATGTFTVLKSNGVNTNTRVIELREARQADLTGTIQDYNTISSLLPQESQIYFQR